MKPVLALGLGSLAILTAVPTFAQPPSWDLQRREDWMQQRIERGRTDGSLDRREARTAERQLRQIRMETQRMRDRNGGRLDDRQRMMLERRLDNLNQHIHWLRNNGERAPWAP